MSSWILLPILVVLSRGRARGAGLCRPDKEKRIQHVCGGNPWEESEPSWARRAVGYGRDPLMGSRRFGAKATLLLGDILMKQFDRVACEGLRSQGSKCSEVTHSLISGWSLWVKNLLSVLGSNF